MKYFIGVEIGGTNLRIGVVDRSFSVIEFEKHPTKHLAESEDKTAYLKELVNPLVEKYGKNHIAAVTMALASLMDRERKQIYTSPMIGGFENLPLVELLETATGLPVIIEKDVNILLLYEIWKKNIPTEGIVAGAFLGTGLGNAMCINGKVYAGSSGTACELGHIPVPDMDMACGCGKKGCIELLTCGKLLNWLAVEKYHCPVTDIFLHYGNRQDIWDIVRYCALAIATEITILDPVCMILGGGVMEMKGFPVERMKEEIRRNLRMPNPREAIAFHMASGDAEAGIVGAAIHAGHKIRN